MRWHRVGQISQSIDRQGDRMNRRLSGERRRIGGEAQCPDGDCIFTQGREANDWSWAKCFHQVKREVGGDGGAQRFAHQRQAAAKDDDLWVAQVDNV